MFFIFFSRTKLDAKYLSVSFNISLIDQRYSSLKKRLNLCHICTFKVGYISCHKVPFWDMCIDWLIKVIYCLLELNKICTEYIKWVYKRYSLMPWLRLIHMKMHACNPLSWLCLISPETQLPRIPSSIETWLLQTPKNTHTQFHLITNDSLLFLIRSHQHTVYKDKNSSSYSQ